MESSAARMWCGDRHMLQHLRARQAPKRSGRSRWASASAPSLPVLVGPTLRTKEKHPAGHATKHRESKLEASEWTLLRCLRLQPAKRGTAALVVSKGAAGGEEVRIDAHGLQSILHSDDFTIFKVPSATEVSELCKLRLTTLLDMRSPPLRLSKSTPDQDGAVMVSIHADLHRLFAEMVTARSSEFAWRFTLSKDDSTKKRDKHFGINSVDIDGGGDAPMPPEFQLPLLPHQLRSLAWMIMRESREELCVHERRCQKPIKGEGVGLSLELQVSEVFSLCGGVLCDPVGSGKTATMLALICSQDRYLQCSGNLHAGTAQATLVLCPANVHAQWLAEVEKFCPALPVIPLRSKQDLETTSHDTLRQSVLVVAPYELFTTPGVAASDGALKDLAWRRVVLDEFHELLRSEKEQSASLKIALSLLKTERRWGLSGTPESFLTSAWQVMDAASYFGADCVASVFVEYFCRQSSVAIPVDVHEHLVHVSQTPAERMLYLHEQSQCGELDLNCIKRGSIQGTRIRNLLFLCSHYLPDGNGWQNVGASDASADQVCALMLQTKEDAITAARKRLNDLPPDLFLDLSSVAESMDQKIRSSMSEMATTYDHTTGERKSDPEKQAICLNISTQLAQPRKIIHDHLPVVKRWANRSGGSAVDLLDLLSPAALLELCSAIDALRAHAVLPSSQEATYKRSLGILCRACKDLVNAERELDFFSRMWDAFRSGSATCPVCLEDVDANIGNFLFCGHVVCVACTQRLQNKASCPTCRCEAPAMRNPEFPWMSVNCKFIPARQFSSQQLKEYQKNWSSKMCKIVETLQDIHVRDADAKVLVFSQWNSLRGHVSRALHDRGVNHLSLEGNIFERSRILQQFQSASVPLLLLSLEDSASGTNLTAASHVFLLHPMLASSKAEAEAFETQAIGRVRRLGQTRPVHVWRFITTGTVEESLWEKFCLPQSMPQGTNVIHVD